MKRGLHERIQQLMHRNGFLFFETFVEVLALQQCGSRLLQFGAPRSPVSDRC